MFKNLLIFVALIAAASVAASVIPTGIDDRGWFDRAVNVTYVGNNLYIGKRTGDDWLQRTVKVNKAAVASRVVTQNLTITTYYKLTYLAVIDNAASVNLGAYPTLVSGGPNQTNTVLLFTSKVGRPINSTVNVYVRY